MDDAAVVQTRTERTRSAVEGSQSAAVGGDADGKENPNEGGSCSSHPDEGRPTRFHPPNVERHVLTLFAERSNQRTGTSVAKRVDTLTQ